MPINWTPAMDAVLLSIVSENPDATWQEIAVLVSEELQYTVTKDMVRNRHSRAMPLSTVEMDDESVTAMRRALLETRNELEQMKVTRQDLQDAIFRAVDQGIAGLNIQPVPQPQYHIDPLYEQRMVMLGADWQTGKYIRGAYNSDIAERRVAQHVGESLELRAVNPYVVNEAHWLLVGDLVEGETIFPSQVYRIDASLFRQVFRVSDMIVNGTRRLLAEVPLVYVEGIGGNHGENLKNSHPETNFDCIAMEVARRILRPEIDAGRLVFPEPITPDEHHWAFTHDVGDVRFWGVHGHQVRSQPNTKSSRDRYLGWYANYGPFDVAVSGHYHQAISQDLGPFEHISGGSPENGNTYAAEYLQTGAQTGSQYTFFVGRERIESSHLIRLK